MRQQQFDHERYMVCPLRMFSCRTHRRRSQRIQRLPKLELHNSTQSRKKNLAKWQLHSAWRRLSVRDNMLPWVGQSTSCQELQPFTACKVLPLFGRWEACGVQGQSSYYFVFFHVSNQIKNIFTPIYQIATRLIAWLGGQCWNNGWSAMERQTPSL